MAQQKIEVIPPIAHFIWAGGKKNITADGVKIISEWIRDNQDIEDFQAWLWVDKKTAADDLLGDYKTLFKSQEINVFDESQVDDIKNLPKPFIILKDIGKNNLRDEYVAYEIEKLRPNYGSSSDLLRYKILFNHGGFYCDCTDVSKGQDSLNKLFDQNFTKHVVYVEHCPQQPDATQENLGKFSVNQIGNDTFVSTKNNSALLKFSITARHRYELSNTLTMNHVVGEF